MPYWRLFYHLIWATRDRLPLIVPELRPELDQLLIAAARKNGILVHAVGGIEDHVHMAVSIPPALSVAHAVGRLKGSSARAEPSTRCRLRMADRIRRGVIHRTPPTQRGGLRDRSASPPRQWHPVAGTGASWRPRQSGLTGNVLGSVLSRLPAGFVQSARSVYRRALSAERPRHRLTDPHGPGLAPYAIGQPPRDPGSSHASSVYHPALPPSYARYRFTAERSCVEWPGMRIPRDWAIKPRPGGCPADAVCYESNGSDPVAVSSISGL